MARKTRAVGEKTRERILEAALPLFAQHGFAGTSTRLVAGAAEVNVATLAYYFDDKEGLYDAVCQRLHEDLAVEMPSMPRLTAPGDLAPWLADRVWEFVTAHRLHIQVLIRNVLDQGGHVPVVDQWSLDLLARADDLVGLFRPAWASPRRRLFVMSVMHAVARFTVENREQLHAMTGHPADLDAEIRAFLTDHLRLNLGLP